MMSLAVINGDLALRPGGFGTVTGAAKTRQDLGLALREPYGVDRFHPMWGSLLDGNIGFTINEAMADDVRSEVVRVIQNYMAVQQAKLVADTINGGPTRLTPDEIVRSISNLEVDQENDRLLVRITLDTGGGRQVTLLQAVTI